MFACTPSIIVPPPDCYPGLDPGSSLTGASAAVFFFCPRGKTLDAGSSPGMTQNEIIIKIMLNIWTKK
jgi:hypothetical protein